MCHSRRDEHNTQYSNLKTDLASLGPSCASIVSGRRQSRAQISYAPTGTEIVYHAEFICHSYSDRRRLYLVPFTPEFRRHAWFPLWTGCIFFDYHRIRGHPACNQEQRSADE
jgi:hypothetical protein